jgi:hypothetical protein
MRHRWGYTSYDDQQCARCSLRRSWQQDGYSSKGGKRFVWLYQTDAGTKALDRVPACLGTVDP